MIRIGPYEVLAEIGRGGMGAVYKARGPDGAIIALKVIRATEDPERVRREARLQAGLGETAGFVEFFASGETPGGCWLAMPFLEGGTLRDRLRKGPLGVEETVEIGKALARAIGIAHERGIVHRDLKPENVLFDRSGRPFIADMGLAKHFRKDVLGGSMSLSLSMGGALKGTIGYAPTEQLEDAKEAGPPADVFALGAILYECLAGKPAFVGANVLAVIEKIETGTYDSLVKERAAVPRALVQIVEKALEHDPADRFANGAELARALESMRERSRVLVPALVLVALVLVGGGAVALGSRLPRGTSQAVPPPVVFSWPSPRRIFPAPCSSLLASTHSRLVDLIGEYDGKVAGQIDALAWLPDGKRILAGIGAVSSRGQWADAIDHTLVLFEATTGRELRRFRGHRNGILSLAVTGDGKRAMTGSADGTIRIWNIETGAALRTIETKFPVHCLAWSAAKPSVVAGGLENGHVVLYDLERGDKRESYRPHTTPVSALTFTRDAGQLVSGGSSAGLYLRILDQGRGENLPNAPGGVGALLMSADDARIFVGSFHPLSSTPAPMPRGVSVYDFVEKAPSVPADAPVREVRALARNDTYVLAGGLDGAIVVHDASTLAPVTSLVSRVESVYALAVSPDGRSAVSGGAGGVLHFWDLEHLRPARAGPFPRYQRIALAPGEKLLAFAGADGSVGVLDRAKRTPLWVQPEAHALQVFHVSFSPDGKHVASASQDSLVKVWDAATGKLELTLRGYPGSAYSAEFSPDSTRLVTCGAVGRLSIWNLASRERVDLPTGTDRIVMGVVFSPGGRSFASFSEDRSVRLWDLETRSEVRRIENAHGDLVGAAAFSPDGRRLLTAGNDHMVRLWDVASGTLVRELPGHARMCWALAFLDARRALVGCYDGTLRLWDVAAGSVIDTISLESSTDWVKHLVVARDGHTVYASTERGVVLELAFD